MLSSTSGSAAMIITHLAQTLAWAVCIFRSPWESGQALACSPGTPSFEFGSCDQSLELHLVASEILRASLTHDDNNSSNRINKWLHASVHQLRNRHQAVHILQVISSAFPMGATIIPTMQREQLRLRDPKQMAEGLTVSEG